MPNQGAVGKQDTQYGFWIIIAGFIVVLLVFLVSVYKWAEAKDVTAVVGSVTGIVGTLAGAYFGVHVGAAGKEKAEQQRDAAQAKVVKIAALLDPSKAQEISNL